MPIDSSSWRIWAETAGWLKYFATTWKVANWCKLMLRIRSPLRKRPNQYIIYYRKILLIKPYRQRGCYGYEHVNAFWRERSSTHVALLYARTSLFLVGSCLRPGLCSLLALWVACRNMAIRGGRGNLGAGSLPALVASPN